MYALVEILGKQYKVEEGDTVRIDRTHAAEGDKLNYPTVLALVNDNIVKFGTPYGEGASIDATLVTEEIAGEKIKVYKYHRRKGYRRTQGHREKYSVIKIEKINA